ncbi:MAG TPA: gluconokinase [Anaerolineales bacterium]|nr:gluconokinase [Anaerolineales bacterium]
MTQHYLGIDLGTGSCKTSLINQNGQIIGIGSGKYASSSGANQWKEQQPDAILNGMIEAVRQVLTNTNIPPSTIRAVSIGSALHGIMAVDSDGSPLTPVYTWADDRAAPQAATIKQSQWADDLYQQTGCPPHGMYPLYKIIWIKENHPDIFNQAAKFISVKEYILAKLCGEFIIDYSVASGTGLLNTHTHQWNPLSLEIAGITSTQLSTLADPRTALAVTNPALAKEMDLPADIPVILGASDAANSNLGAGAINERQATCMIGTSGAYRIISSRPLLHPDASLWCYCVDETHWLVGGAINNGGLAITWLKDTLNELAPITFEELLAAAAQSLPGADGVICLPFFAGERSPNWNLDARAAFFGLSIEHSLPQVARAILEGVAFRLRSLDEILFDMSDSIEEVRASGGFTQSEFWVQLIADVLGRPISVPAEGETSTLGAAMWAYLGENSSTSFENISPWVSLSKTFAPNPTTHEKYNEVYSIYKKLYQSLSIHFHEMRLV